jgi:hypothetical protein
MSKIDAVRPGVEIQASTDRVLAMLASRSLSVGGSPHERAKEGA